MDIYRLLAIDYGEKRIGLAISDPLRTIGRPYQVLSNKPGFFADLQAIITQENVGRLIIGLPLNFSGNDTQKTREVRTFANELSTHIDIPWEFVNESFTTQDANEALKSMGLNIKDSKKVIDKVAAALILQHYLENCS
jgi:putative holliday junction resolvase